MRSNDRVEQNNSSLSAGSCLKGNTPGCYETRPQWSRSGAADAEAFCDFGVYDQVLTGNERAVSVAFLMLTSCDGDVNIHELGRKGAGFLESGDRKFSIKAERKHVVCECVSEEEKE